MTVEAPELAVPEQLRSGRLVVLTGAGLSTDSGIPDYRGPGSRSRTSRPMTYQEFLSGPSARQRYWARSHLGWSRMGGAAPNAGHRALAAVDPELLITQNVDGLHEAAGSRRLVALHGRIADVVCLSCRRTTSRARLAERMAVANPGYADAHAAAATRPDGDVDLDDTAGFVASCRANRVTPHVAQNGGRPGGSAIDERTTRWPGYAVSQQKRKRIEQVFGWGKTVGRIRQVMYRGLERVDQFFVLTQVGYNLTRMRTLGG